MSVSDEEWNEINENYINELKAEIERLRGALEEIREYERVVHAGSKPWSIANKVLAGETK